MRKLIAPTVLMVLLIGGCSGGTRKPLVELFEKLTPMTPREATAKAFNTYDADERRVGVAALSAAPFGGESAYVRMYRLVVTDSDPTVRATCMKALGMHGDVEDAPILIEALGDKQEPAAVRWEAAKGLRKIHNPEAIPALNTATRDEDVDVRIAAVDALGQYPQLSVFHSLVGALDDRDLGVALTARRSLQTLTGQDFHLSGARWMQWAEKNKDNLFQDSRPYTYTPYQPPKSMFQKMRFWEKDTPVEQRTPKGVSDPQALLSADQ